MTARLTPATWALLAATALATFGCKSRARERVAAPKIRTLSGPPGVDTKDPNALLEARLEKRLPEALPSFEWSKPTDEGPRWQLEATLELSESTRAKATEEGVLPEDQVLRGVRLELRLSLLGAEVQTGARREQNASSVVARNVPVFDGFGPLIEEAVEGALRQLEVERELVTAPVDRVQAVLADSDPALRARAVEAARERLLVELVPALLERLADDREEPEVVMKSIGALVALKDPRAVPALIDSARRRSPIYLTQIIFGVAEIGGKEAEAYLFTVARGHPDEQVRKNAEDALEELGRRKGRTSSEKETQ